MSAGKGAVVRAARRLASRRRTVIQTGMKAVLRQCAKNESGDELQKERKSEEILLFPTDSKAVSLRIFLQQLWFICSSCPIE